MYLNILKAVNDRLLDIILNGEKLKPFPLKLGMTQGCLFSSLLFNIILECLGRGLRQEELKGIKIGK
jgi:hypothetical protein